MKKILLTILALITLLAFGGCATIKMELSVYKGDLEIPEQTATLDAYDVQQLKTYLKEAETAANAIATQRTEQAEQALKLLRQGCRARKENKGGTDFSKCSYGLVSNEKKIFDQELEARLKAAQDAIANARYKLDKYQAQSTASRQEKRKQSTQIGESVKAVSQRLEDLNESLDTKFEVTILDNTKTIIDYAKNDASGTEGEAKKLKKLIDDLESDNPKYSLTQLESLKVNVETPESKKVAQAIVESADLQSTYLYRMQDPADPIWQTVTDPKNLHHWKTQDFVTKSTAWGEAEIVVVQDTPLMNRIQQVHGDPSSVLASELLVSRAIGMAAMEIAGINVGSSSDSSSASTTIIESQLKTLQSDYTTAKKRLIAKLETLQTELKAQSTDEDIKTTDNAINGTLKGFRATFKTIAGQKMKD